MVVDGRLEARCYIQRAFFLSRQSVGKPSFDFGAGEEDAATVPELGRCKWVVSAPQTESFAVDIGELKYFVDGHHVGAVH